MDILKHTHTTEDMGSIQINTRTYVHTEMRDVLRTYIRTYIHSNVHARTHSHECIHTDTNTHEFAHTKTHTQVLSYSSVSMCTYIRTYVHTNVRLIDSAYLHAPHTHRHTHACTHLMIDVCFTMMSIVSFPSTIGICTVSFQVGVFDFLAD